MTSNCCNAPIKVSTADEGTSCYICTKCDRPCDPFSMSTSQKLPEAKKRFFDTFVKTRPNGRWDEDYLWEEPQKSCWKWFESELSLATQQARDEERKRAEIDKLASNIALMKILVERGKKGDMERLISEFTEKLKVLSPSKEEKQKEFKGLICNTEPEYQM